MKTNGPKINVRVARLLLTGLNPRLRYHRAEIIFPERLPADGAAVIVSNHGRLDFDSFILARLILGSRKRLVRLMADHLWFRLPGLGRIMTLAGGVDGTRENAGRLLENGELILTYPGGVPEIMNSRFGREQIDWQGRNGFAHVAVAARAPVIPIAGIGVNNGFIFLTSGRRLGRLLYKKIFGLGPAYDKYRDPLALGLLPLPFSLAVHFPLPCKVRYIVGEPVYPDECLADGDQRAQDLALRVAAALRGLLSENN